MTPIYCKKRFWSIVPAAFSVHEEGENSMIKKGENCDVTDKEEWKNWLSPLPIYASTLSLLSFSSSHRVQSIPIPDRRRDRLLWIVGSLNIQVLRLIKF